MLIATLAAIAWIGALQAPAGRIDGRVIGVDARPAAGVRVILGEIGRATLHYNRPEAMLVATPGIPDAERARWSAELRTDAEGRFAATGLAPGEYSLLAADETRGIELGSLRVGAEPARVELALRAPAFLEAEITGMPFDPQSDVIQLDALGTGSNVQINPTLVQPRGQWSFRSAPLPQGPTWRVRGTSVVRPQGFPATKFALTIALQPGERRRIELDLGRGLAVAGSVVDAAGRPLPCVSVVARASGAGEPERGAVTDAQGRYQIRGLAAGPTVLEASRWSMRSLAGCGTGPRDVSALRELVLPLESSALADIRIDDLLGAPAVGDPAPAFSVPTLDGGTIELGALRGKVVLIDFWATWCGMCRMEMPRLVETYARLSAGGRFEVVGVSVDKDVDLVPRFVASRGLLWKQTALGPASENAIARLYNVNSTPATVLVDASGRIAALNLTGEELVRKIDELLRP